MTGVQDHIKSRCWAHTVWGFQDTCWHVIISKIPDLDTLTSRCKMSSSETDQRPKTNGKHDVKKKIHPWMTLTKRARHSTCDIQSFSSLLSVVFPNINNLSGVVKDAGRISGMGHGQNHRHDTYFRSTQWRPSHRVHLVHVSLACYTQKLRYWSTETPCTVRLLPLMRL